MRAQIIAIAAILCCAAFLLSCNISPSYDTSLLDAQDYTELAPILYEIDDEDEMIYMEEVNVIEEVEVEAILELEEPIDPINEAIAQMTLYEKIGQIFVIRLPDPNSARRLIEDHHIGGFIFFSDHVSSTEQVQQQIATLQDASTIPLFIAVDEEGGRVSRIGRLFPAQIGTALSLGNTGDTQVAYDAYYTIGQQLSYLGFNMNFAPVADIWTNPANTVIGDRAFGTEPELVANMTVAAVQGLQSAGILSVIKHFPGHGDTVEDSHYNMAFYNHNCERFNEIEAIPFRRGIDAQTDGVMIGHIATPYFHPDYPSKPAVFSSYWMEQVLRTEWGFDGLIITDALDMRGLTNYYSNSDIALNAFLGGADILLMPVNPEEAITAMVEAYNNGKFTQDRLDASLRRILSAKLHI